MLIDAWCFYWLFGRAREDRAASATQMLKYSQSTSRAPALVPQTTIVQDAYENYHPSGDYRMHFHLCTVLGPQLCPIVNETVPAEWKVKGLRDNHARGNAVPMMWSVVPPRSPLKVHSLWDLASFTPGSATGCLLHCFKLLIFIRILLLPMMWPMMGDRSVASTSPTPWMPSRFRYVTRSVTSWLVDR